MLVDSHCHLNFPDFKDDIDDVIQRAKEAGVGIMQTICTDMAEFPKVHAIALAHDNIYCSVGVHPNDSGKFEIVNADTLVQHAAYDKVIGIGETGLDYYYEHSDRDMQKQSFLEHMKASRISGLPLIVHTRNAEEDTVDMLAAEMANGPFKGLIHCFTSTQYLAEKSLELGFYISISGIITFKSAQAIRDVVAMVPLERLLVETDAPYLAPMPNRGKRNEPSFVKYTNKILADIKGISEEECAAITTENFFRLFDKVPPPSGLSTCK